SHEKPLEETIVLTSTEGGQVSGIVTDSMTSSPIEQVEVTLYDSNKEVVGDTVTASNGYYEFTGVDSGDYRIKFKHEDYVLSEEELTVSDGVAEQDQQLDPVPAFAILGDRTIGDDTLEAILDDVNIDATNYGSIETLTDELEAYDVVFFNEASSLKDSDFQKFEEAIDKHHVSVIYGDQYFSGGGIYTLHRLNEDPAVRDTINIRDRA